MRLFCWNVNSLVPTVRNVNLKYGSLAAFFAHLDADIVCMQEVKLPDSKLTKDLVVVEGYQSYWACSHSKTGYSGVTTWARVGCAAVEAQADPFTCEGCDREGRALVTDHGSFVLFNVYVPNAGERPERARLAAKLSFLAALKEQVDDLLGSGRQVVLVGDFNVAAEQRDVHPSITWDTLYHPAELKALHDLMDPSGSSCTDTWRHLHPLTDQVYTVWEERTSARAFNVGLRIDYALVSRGLLDQVVSSEVLLDLPPKWSDHAPLLLELSLHPPPDDLRAPDTGPGSSTAHKGAATSEHRRQGGPDTQHQQQQQQVSPQAPPECPMWQQLLRRFQDPSQRSIASMFKAAGQHTSSAKRHKPAETPLTTAAAAEASGLPQAPSTAAAAAASPPALPQHEEDLSTRAAADAASNFGAESSSKQQQQQLTPHAAKGSPVEPLPQQTSSAMQPKQQAGSQQAVGTSNSSGKPAAGSRSGGPASAVGGGGGGRQARGTKRKPQGTSKAAASAAAVCPKQAKLHTFFSAAAPAGRTSPPAQGS